MDAKSFGVFLAQQRKSKDLHRQNLPNSYT